MGIECPHRRLLHVVREWGYLEIVDDKGDFLPSGMEGNIVYTSFENDVSPFIRYKVGDRGKILENNGCACGNKAPFLVFEGRAADIIVLPNGHAVTCLGLHRTLTKEFSDLIYQFRFIQQTPLRLVVEIVPSPLFNTNVHKDQIIGRLQMVTEGFLEIEISIVGYIDIRAGKIPALVRNF